MARVVISLVTWNSEGDVPACLRAIEGQTYKDFKLVVVDNASRDGTADLVRNSQFPIPNSQFICNAENCGFAAAHNQAMRRAREHNAEFVLVINPDVTLTANAIEEMIAAMERHPKAGSVGIPLLHSDQTVDSLGLAIGWGGRWYERGVGGTSRQSSKNNPDEQVLGISGACVMYRLATNESFDERFFAYKEDADLALRLREQGWESWLTHAAHAIHARKLKDASHGFVQLQYRGRTQRSLQRSYLSYRNHLFLLKKHWHHLPVSRIGVVLYELGKVLYAVVREPQLLKAWKEVWNLKFEI